MHNFRKNIIANAVFVLVLVGRGSCNNGLREKRSLLWFGTSDRVQSIIGFGVPVDLRNQAVVVGVALKGEYYLPTNSSIYTRPTVTLLRKKRSLSRWDVYAMLSQAAEIYGFGGKPCVMRAICEVADSPIDRNSGLIGEMFHTLLTPTTTKEELNHHADNEYYAAHRIGRNVNGNCADYFRECRISFVDMFSKLSHSLF